MSPESLSIKSIFIFEAKFDMTFYRWKFSNSLLNSFFTLSIESTSLNFYKIVIVKTITLLHVMGLYFNSVHFYVQWQPFFWVFNEKKTQFDLRYFSKVAIKWNRLVANTKQKRVSKMISWKINDGRSFFLESAKGSKTAFFLEVFHSTF